MIVAFHDLNPVDQERLLQEAREIIEKEHIEKDAIATYNLKKRELIRNNLEEVYKAYSAIYSTQKASIEQKYKAIVNYMYKENVIGKNPNIKKANVVISTPEQWEIYHKIAYAVKDMMITCHNI